MALAEKKSAQLEDAVTMMKDGNRDQAIAVLRGSQADRLLDEIKVWQEYVKIAKIEPI